MVTFSTFAGEVGCVAAQNGQGVVRRQRGLADSGDEGVPGRHQAQTPTQRGHGEFCLQDVLCGRLIRAERQEEGGTTTGVNEEFHFIQFFAEIQAA